jgi:hypothetical protein
MNKGKKNLDLNLQKKELVSQKKRQGVSTVKGVQQQQISQKRRLDRFFRPKTHFL